MSCFWSHKFGKWKKKAEGNISHKSVRDGENIVDGNWVDQERQCETCGFIEINTQVQRI